MKKRMFHKGMAAVLAVSLTTGGALPFMAQTVHAEDTAAEQGQTPEKKSGTVTLEKKNDGTYVFGNEYLKRTFSLSADNTDFSAGGIYPAGSFAVWIKDKTIEYGT